MTGERDRPVTLPGRVEIQMGYVQVSSEADSFADRLNSSSYVDPPSFSLQLTPDTHHPESVPRSVPESVSRTAGRPYTHLKLS